MFEYMKERLIYNAGTMAGEFNTMIDLFLQIFMLSMGGNLQELQPDQAAYNILLSLEPFKNITDVYEFRRWMGCSTWYMLVTSYV
jgi:hypothetical protein